MRLRSMLQFVIGDAIVWWRTCVIWQNKVVYCIGPLLVAFSVGVPYLLQTPVYHHRRLTPQTFLASSDWSSHKPCGWPTLSF